ncbi:hypothetical protein N0V90_012755 [Kalmusia sp. IMI 367209]|nr:hypothetical protein N0V90_012755 [Kalmusia sp. IMI 367209]
MPEFAFVTVGEQGKVSKDDDWLVRSHCMLGKNKKNRPRRAKTAKTAKTKYNAPASSRKTAEKQITVRSVDDLFEIKLPSTLDLDPSTFFPQKTLPWLVTSHEAIGRANAIMVHANPALVARHIATVSALYPLDHHFDHDPTLRDEDLPLEDQGALNTALMIASAHNDYIAYQTPSTLTRVHISNSLTHLNKLLLNEASYARDMAICMILHLTAVATLFGDYEAAYTHLHGVNKLMRLCKQNPRYKLWKMKVERLDFWLSLVTGRNGPFFDEEPASWDAVCGSQADVPCILVTGIPKLDTIFHDLRLKAQYIKDKTAKGARVDAEYFRTVVHSLQLRLLKIQPCPENTFAECLRLGMQAVLSTQTQIPMRRLEHPYLTAQFRAQLPRLQVPADQYDKDVIFWVIIVAFIVALDREQESWAEPLFRQVADGIDAWPLARSRLHGVMWIPGLLDAPGEAVFRKLRKRWPVEEDSSPSSVL